MNFKKYNWNRTKKNRHRKIKAQEYPMSTIKSNDNIMQQSKTHKYSTSISCKWKSEITSKKRILWSVKRGWNALHFIYCIDFWLRQTTSKTWIYKTYWILSCLSNNSHNTTISPSIWDCVRQLNNRISVTPKYCPKTV